MHESGGSDLESGKKWGNVGKNRYKGRGNEKTVPGGLKKRNLFNTY